MRLTKQQRDAGRKGLWGNGAFKSNTGNFYRPDYFDTDKSRKISNQPHFLLCLTSRFSFLGICYQIIEESGVNGQSSYTFKKVDHVSDNSIEHVPKRYLGQYQSRVKWSHLVFMGNALDVGKDGSLVFGMPYAWIGDNWDRRGLLEKRTGTIARFKVKGKIEVPNPLDKSINGYGAIWAFSTAQREATSSDPHRNDLTGTSFVKGVL